MCDFRPKAAARSCASIKKVRDFCPKTAARSRASIKERRDLVQGPLPGAVPVPAVPECCGGAVPL